MVVYTGLDALDLCSILKPSFDNVSGRDYSGCLKTNAHNDTHIAVLENGRIIEWKSDWECTCEDCMSGDGDGCFTYNYISVEEATDKLQKYFNQRIPQPILELFEQIK